MVADIETKVVYDKTTEEFSPPGWMEQGFKGPLIPAERTVMNMTMDGPNAGSIHLGQQEIGSKTVRSVSLTRDMVEFIQKLQLPYRRGH